MTNFLERVVVPIASQDDATATCRALAGYLQPGDEVIAVHVIEKAGGAPDKASVEQRELAAEDLFTIVREELPDAETEIRYGTDVAETVFAAAEEHGATSIVFTPRGGGRWIRLLTGDVTLSLVTETDRPVVVLPDVVPTDDGQPADAGNGRPADARK